jgi:hypothetical protein
VSYDTAPITVRVPLSLELVYGVAQTIRAPLWRDGVPVTATTATARLLDASGTEVASGGAVTDGVATWAMTSTHTTQVKEDGYRVEWTIGTADGAVYATSAAAVVRRALYPVITDADLYRRHPTLNPDASGYVGEQDLESWQDYIDEAWTELLGRIWGQGRRPALIMSPEALRQVHLYLSLAIIWRSLRGDYEMLAQQYDQMYAASWAQLRFVYDSDDDGTPDDSGQRQAAVSTVWL